MNLKSAIYGSVFVILLTYCAASSQAQLLYSENFDDLNAASRWTDNSATSPTDSYLDFAFDYGAEAGIPPAPNTQDGSTIGMVLQANLFSNVFGGMSVSPTGQSFTGDYVLSFDMWQNYNGPLAAGGNGSTQLSYGGIMTSGTSNNYPGIVDGVWFAATGDGGSAADYRAYSHDRPISYQWPRAAGNAQDLAGTYLANSRNNTATYYRENINPAPDPVNAPSVGEVTAPAAQLALYPQQTEAVQSGAPGMTWRHHEIEKLGDIITWYIDGTPLIVIDSSLWVNPNPGGTNILFGHSDINAASSTDPNSDFLLFTLVDNIEVNALSPAQNNADFDSDGYVDGSDFLTWQRNFGISDGSAGLVDGDANGDGNVNGADLGVWENQFGTVPAAAAVAVPEPTTLIMFGLGVLCLAMGRRTD